MEECAVDALKAMYDWTMQQEADKAYQTADKVQYRNGYMDAVGKAEEWLKNNLVGDMNAIALHLVITQVFEKAMEKELWRQSNEQKANEIAGVFVQEDTARFAARRKAQWKDEQHEQEKQQWIDKACEWWENELTYPTMTQAEINWYQTKIAEFKKVMKGE